MNFTHLSHKTSYITPSKTVYIYTFATVTVYTIILLISHLFFSLLRAKQTQSQTSPLLVFFFLRYTQTHPHKHIHTDKSTLRYTNAHTRTNQQRDRSVLVLVACGSVDRCWWRQIRVHASTEMGLDTCGSVLVAKISACGSTKCVLMLVDQCWLARSMLMGQRSPCLWVLILVVLVVEIVACGG